MSWEISVLHLVSSRALISRYITITAIGRENVLGFLWPRSQSAGLVSVDDPTVRDCLQGLSNLEPRTSAFPPIPHLASFSMELWSSDVLSALHIYLGQGWPISLSQAPDRNIISCITPHCHILPQYTFNPYFLVFRAKCLQARRLYFIILSILRLIVLISLTRHV